MTRWLPLVAAALLLVGCESVLAPPATTRGQADEIARLKELVLELQRQARMSEVEISRLRKQIADLETRIDEPGPQTGTRVPASSSTPPPDALAEEDRGVIAVRPISGEPLQQEDLEMPVSVPATPPTATIQAEAAAASPSVEDLPLSSEGQALYDRGYTLYHQGRYLDAETTFQTFLQRYGTTDLADNAQFWIGEARFRRGDHRGALAAFRETIERFPRANKVPDALFKVGDCLEKIGDREAARSAWQEVGRRFPSSAAAILAEERLADLP